MGAPKGSQRRLGKPNKRSVEIADKLAALGCDPIEGMARIALECETGFYNRLKELADGNDVDVGGMLKDLALAGQMYKELAQYVAPKRKAIEHSGPGGSDIKTVSRIEIVPFGQG